MKRAIVFAHYDKDNIVDPYVYNYLASLQKNSDALVFVSTVTLSKTEQENLKKYCTYVIVRENEGYDFMSYKVGLEQLNYEDLDEIIICNDSVYAPLFFLENTLMTMESRDDIDFWGITDNYAFAHHIQSYFVAFKKNVFTSQTFQDFWKNLEILYDKKKIIQEYEVGLTTTLNKANFKFDVFYNYKPTKLEEFISRIKKLTLKRLVNKIQRIVYKQDRFSLFGSINYTHFFWEDMIKYKVPFLKIELLRDNPYKINITNIYEVIKNETHYDIKLIQNHLKRVQRK